MPSADLAPGKSMMTSVRRLGASNTVTTQQELHRRALESECQRTTVGDSSHQHPRSGTEGQQRWQPGRPGSQRLGARRRSRPRLVQVDRARMLVQLGNSNPRPPDLQIAANGHPGAASYAERDPDCTVAGQSKPCRLRLGVSNPFLHTISMTSTQRRHTRALASCAIGRGCASVTALGCGTEPLPGRGFRRFRW